MGLVIIADADAGFCRRTRAVLTDRKDVRVEDVRTLADAAVLIGLRAPDVLLAGPSIDTGEAVAFAEDLRRDHPDCEVVIVAAEVTTTLLRQAMRVGVRDVVPADAADEIAEALRAAAAAASVPETVAAAADDAPRGRVITFFSTKGGVGKSFVASNVAVALAESGASTVLVDLDLQFGDMGILLDLKPERTIFDAAQAYDRLDAEMLRGFLTEHPSGLKVLLAPLRPEDAEVVTVSRVATIIGLLREMADFVVLDTATAFDDVVLGAIDASDAVYAVATMDVPSIKNTRVSLQKLRQLGYDPGKVKLVVNRADSKVWLDADEVEQSVEVEAAAKIPSDRLVPRSINRGVPIVLDSPRSPVSRSLTDLAATIKSEKSEVASGVA
jgi:pilus assembly protein CpaE